MSNNRALSWREAQERRYSDEAITGARQAYKDGLLDDYDYSSYMCRAFSFRFSDVPVEAQKKMSHAEAEEAMRRMFRRMMGLE